MARMPRARRDEADPTVAMLVVVPAHERQDPRAGRLPGGKALGGIRRPVFTRPEERFGERVIVADARPTIRYQDPQAFQRGAERRSFHRAAVVGVQDQRLEQSPVCHDGPLHDRGGMLTRFLLEDLPADDLATMEITDQVAVEEQAFGQA